MSTREAGDGWNKFCLEENVLVLPGACLEVSWGSLKLGREDWGSKGGELGSLIRGAGWVSLNGLAAARGFGGTREGQTRLRTPVEGLVETGTRWARRRYPRLPGPARMEKEPGKMAYLAGIGAEAGFALVDLRFHRAECRGEQEVSRAAHGGRR